MIRALPFRMLSVAVLGAAMAPVSGFAAACGGHGDRSTLLVSTKWLAGHLRDPNLVILAVGGKGEYEKAHIPGALFLQYQDIYTMDSGLAVQLPPIGTLTDVFEKLGLTNGSHIVVYMTKDWTFPTARVFVTLDAMGLGSHTSILDGGFPAWQREGRPATTKVRPLSRSRLTPCPQSDVIANLSQVRSSLHNPHVNIVDARLPSFYTGQQVPHGQRAGHVPGATSLTFAALLDGDGKLKSPATLQQIFQAARVHTGNRIVSYCHVGQQASLVYFVARYLGYDARLFDGSWQEWSAHAELPTEVSAGNLGR